MSPNDYAYIHGTWKPIYNEDGDKIGEEAMNIRSKYRTEKLLTEF